VLLAAFVVIERRSADPLVRLSIFSVRTVRGANVAMFIVAAGLFAMFFFNTLYLQRVLGYSPLEAGLAFLPFTLGIIIGAGVSQRLVPALGAREVPIIGLALAVVGLMLFLRLTPVGTSYVVDLLPGIMLVSIGMGLTFVPVTLIATSGVPHGDAGLASGLFNTSQQIGGALGLAVLSTIATSKTTGVIEDLGHRPSGSETASALVDGFHLAWIGTAALLVAGALLLVVLLRRSDVVAVSEGEAAPVVA
jgi:predicted MFS family arabinose efflux permease